MEEKFAKWFKGFEDSVDKIAGIDCADSARDEFEAEFEKMYVFMSGILGEIYDIKLSTIMLDMVYNQVEFNFIFRSKNVSFRDNRGYTISLPITFNKE